MRIYSVLGLLSLFFISTNQDSVPSDAVAPAEVEPAEAAPIVIDAAGEAEEP